MHVRPTIFAISVRNVRYSLSATPLRMVFISGIPDPKNKQTNNKIYKKYSLKICQYNIALQFLWNLLMPRVDF